MYSSKEMTAQVQMNSNKKTFILFTKYLNKLALHDQIFITQPNTTNFYPHNYRIVTNNELWVINFYPK